MNIIIDFSKCSFLDKKVSGVPLFLRFFLALSADNTGKIITVNAKQEYLKIAAGHKKVNLKIENYTDIKMALEKIKGPSAVFTKDIVFYPGLIKELKQAQENVLISNTGIFILSENARQSINNHNDLEQKCSTVIDIKSVVYPIETEKDIKTTEKKMLKGLRTPGDTLVSRLMNRRISIWVTSKIMGTGITPNMITTFNFILGIAGVLCLWFVPGYMKTVLAGTFIQLSSILDGCDGEIARLKYQGSKFGAKFDDFSDEITNFLFYTSAALYTAFFWIKLPTTYPINLPGAQTVYCLSSYPWVVTLTKVFAITGAIVFTLGQIISIWLRPKLGITNVKDQVFYFEKQSENWGKNPLHWFVTLGKHLIRNDFLALLAFVAGIFHYYWLGPYIIIMFGTAYFVTIFLEAIHYLKNRKKSM